MIVGITGLIGVLTGAVVVYIGMILQMRHLENKEQRRRELELKVKEIETLNQLNKRSTRSCKTDNADGRICQL